MVPSLKQFMPKSLLGRALLIIVTPLVLLQVVAALIFFESHWDKVALRLAQGVAGDIGAVIGLLRAMPGPENQAWIFEMADDHMQLELVFKNGAVLPNTAQQPAGALAVTLAHAMEDYVGLPFRYDTASMPRSVRVQVQLAEGVLDVVTTRKRLFSSTTYVFVIWMVGTSLILFGVATIFMRNQVRPIRRLALAADNFGKGRDVARFKPEGAAEVRQAATAFIAMKERLSRQIAQRTDMLAGVSHDLRTPLTRMRLQLAMLGDDEGAKELQADIAEMEQMLDGYLAFARGEGAENPVPTNLSAMMVDVIAQARRNGAQIDLHSEGEILVPLRPNVFKRCLTNLIDNAARYAEHVSVRAGRRGEAIEVTIDDDGPGIPEDQRADVFKPFFRLEQSRNTGTGGVGLGLTIALDVVRGHGGDIELSESPSGGLRARIRLPL